MSILSLVGGRNYILYNRPIAKALGIEASILLGELASEQQYWEETERIENGYFYSTVDNLMDRTALTKGKIRSSIKLLNSIGILDIRENGLPKRRYFHINEAGLEIFMNTLSRTGGAELAHQEILKAEPLEAQHLIPIDTSNPDNKNYSTETINKNTITENNTLDNTVIETLLSDCMVKSPEHISLITDCIHSGMAPEVIRHALKLPFSRNSEAYLCGEEMPVRNVENYGYAVLRRWKEANVKSVADEIKYNKFHRNDREMKSLSP